MERNRANGGAAEGDGKSLTTAGLRWPNGLGVHANSEVYVALDDRYDRFSAYAGIDDSAGAKASVVFEVYVDGVLRYRSPVMKRAMPPVPVMVPVENAKMLRLVALHSGDGTTDDIADWAFARLDGVESVKYLSDLKWVSSVNGAGPAERDLANGGVAEKDGGKITLRGETYRKGVGVKANSEISLNLDGQYELFTAALGIDDSAQGKGSAIFEIWSGTTLLYRSPLLTGAMAPRQVALNVRGKYLLSLKVLDGRDGTENDLADWADAKFLPLGSDIAPGLLPSAPTQLTAAPGADGVELNWVRGNNTVSFNVHRSTMAGSASPPTVERMS